MIRAYDDNGNVVDLVEWEEKIRVDERAKVLKEVESELLANGFIWTSHADDVWRCITKKLLKEQNNE